MPTVVARNAPTNLPAITALTGDLTATGPGSVVATLKNTGPGATGPIGDATHVAQTTIDAQGRVTALNSVAITFPTAIVYDTEANILASTPAAGIVAVSSDTYYLFESLGAGIWKRTALPLGDAGPLPDMGAIPYRQDWGYGIKDLASKNLHNVVMRDFEAGVTQLENGAFRYNAATSALELYQGGAWLTVITLTSAQVRDWMLRSQWNAYSATPAPSVDTLSKTLMTLGFVDMGAIPADVILDGGELL